MHLADALGLPLRSVHRMLGVCPPLSQFSHATLAARKQLLQEELGLPAEQVADMVMQQPRLLVMSDRKLMDQLQLWQQRLRLSWPETVQVGDCTSLA